ncbi:phosphogluconate dehydratase [Actinoalloteichus sp. AHMU CJ021]|uniref:Phosphogluconate dehydratase n=1 Tax=Actinoalloteichus caeruleus DSM 43889 TaxID=1120930 RepID=A0ABT1JHN1_ACTCY|nr:phosphogluconate dehydratase [Actinoalloteichus caeruleus]AUS77848.1 phosphogluconate dehydratase [Actinoalloteichus sp. AHMU CJ021]MCP2331804.1 6-phosphogluconate dehydratase [Actinoalloteichus caeruleus DSM 43889]
MDSAAADRTTTPHPVVAAVTRRIVERSSQSRAAYLARTRAAASQGPVRMGLPCSNLAHGFAACSGSDLLALRGAVKPGVAIVSAYNDMLSAHQPLDEFPAWIKDSVRQAGGVAQFAGGVPAMCDGITQGRDGMELSLFSRDVIAMSTGIALSHDMFDAALLLGVCDKIVPGLVIGALSFGHLPVILVPAGPMPSGLPNKEKARVRQLYAEGQASRDDLLAAEAASYHSPGTCTFYGTANSNQLLMEVMGLHLPGSSFVQPGTPLRQALTEYAGRRAVALSALGDEYTPMAEVVNERTIVNGVVALLATGGSTNHTMHLVAMAAAAGITLTWDDFDELSSVVPLLARVYPNGPADINHFSAAGGVPFLVRELLAAGLLHADVPTVAGHGLERYRQEPFLVDGELVWRDGTDTSLDPEVLRPATDPFAGDGGLRVLRGNLGRAVIKVSAVAAEHRTVIAPARVFASQEAFTSAFRAGELNTDLVAVLPNQGPRAKGMPELHGLTPALGSLLDHGHRVALVTDGRMSGASGKVPAAIQVSPEAAVGGPLGRIRDGDLVRVDSERGSLEVLVPDEELAARAVTDLPPTQAEWAGTGRELFGALRGSVGQAEHGASVFAPWGAEAASPAPSEVEAHQ